MADGQTTAGKHGDDTANARQIPGNSAGHLEVIENSSDANTRQMPESAFGHLETDLAGIWDQLPQQLPDDDNFDQPDSGRAELWRLEKDGKKHARWRLRFDPERRSQPAGEINDFIRAGLAARPGKGRHASSRADAGRLKPEAEYLAHCIRAGAARRTKGAKLRPKRTPGAHPARRGKVPDLQGVEIERMPDLRSDKLM